MQEPNVDHYKKDLGLAAAGILSILLFITLTNPAKLSAVFLLVFPVMVAGTCAIIIKMTLTFFTSWKKEAIKIVSSVTSVGLLLIVLLGSLGQLGFQDMLLAFLLVAGLVFYLKRTQTA